MSIKSCQQNLSLNYPASETSAFKSWFLERYCNTRYNYSSQLLLSLSLSYSNCDLFQSILLIHFYMVIFLLLFMHASWHYYKYISLVKKFLILVLILVLDIDLRLSANKISKQISLVYRNSLDIWARIFLIELDQNKHFFIIKHVQIQQ